AALSFGGGAGSAALVLEVLVGRHGTVQRVGDPVLGLAIGCPVALCHSCVGILDGLVHVGQGLIQPLLGSAVLGRGLLGRRFFGGLLLGRLLLACSLDSALTGLGIGRAGDTIGVRDLGVTGLRAGVTAEDQVESLVQGGGETDLVTEGDQHHLQQRVLGAASDRKSVV